MSEASFCWFCGGGLAPSFAQISFEGSELRVHHACKDKAEESFKPQRPYVGAIDRTSGREDWNHEQLFNLPECL